LRVECPVCSRTLVVSGGRPDEIVVCQFCGGQMRLPESVDPDPAGDAVPSGGEASPPQEFPGAGVRPGQKRCPHCGEVVLGTEARCPYCDTLFDPARKDEARDGPPWEQREQLGLWKSAWKTFTGAMFDPVRTFDRARTTGFVRALTFSLFSAFVGSVFAAFYYLLMNTPQLLMMASVSSGPGGAGAPGFPGAGFFVIVILVMTLVMFLFSFGGHLAWVILFSGMNHLGLKVFKGANEEFVTTFRATAYACSSAHFWNVVPFCGGLIGLIWGVVASVFAVARMHRTDYGKAVLGVVIPLACLVLLSVAAVVIFMSSVFYLAES
jgi:hypothetical protein